MGRTTTAPRSAAWAAIEAVREGNPLERVADRPVPKMSKDVPPSATLTSNAPRPVYEWWRSAGSVDEAGLYFRANEPGSPRALPLGMRTALYPGVGIGWRPELAADLLRAPRVVDFIEVVAETCFAQPAARREARALAEIWSVVPHGVKLSLGSADGIDLDKARRLGALARELRAPAISEHVALTCGGGREIGHLTPLPFTRDAISVLARNVAAARRVLPDVPFLLENVAWTFRWPEDAIPEADFYAEVVKATGCDLLLDVANLFANAHNAGLDPATALRGYPLDRVAMVHVAGGDLEDGFYLDTHAHPVPDAVFGLLGTLLDRTGALPVVLERDSRFPAFPEVRGEIDRIRSVCGARPAVLRDRETPPASAPAASPEGSSPRELAGQQARLATWLTTEAFAPHEVAGFDLDALRRTRSVLQHKRVDDALPLLPRTAAQGEAARAAAFAALRGTPRPASAAGVADAVRIAKKAATDSRLAAAAARDLVELRARFATGGAADGPRPRFGPFVGRQTLPQGRAVWAVKGPGREAGVRLFEFGGEP
jgi:uncharacterized protein